MSGSLLRNAGIAVMAAGSLVLGGSSGVNAATSARLAPHPPGAQLRANAAVQSTSVRSSAPICYYGACYSYVAARQFVTASGAAVVMRQERPELDPTDPSGHTLQELAVQSADAQQIVEVGWTVDRGLNGDSAPHLFVYHWVNGQTTCYNGCGFVRTSTKVRPGMRVTPGRTAALGIRFHDKGWWVMYDGQSVGYYPARLWSGGFTRAGLV